MLNYSNIPNALKEAIMSNTVTDKQRTILVIALSVMAIGVGIGVLFFSISSVIKALSFVGLI